MGEANESIKGERPQRSSETKLPDGQNLLQIVTALCDELGRLAVIKQDDMLTEGAAVKPENTRKAATLSACFRLANAIRTMLEDY